MEAAKFILGSDLISDPFEERCNSSENSGDPPACTTTVSVSSPKRSRRGIQKRVVKVPIKDIEVGGGRFSKGDCTTPPSDSWAWRKYGQKPIKGSPYPRGYYRCSSSKGCPARKQVERNRMDPTMLLITYSYDHNHSFPVSRNHHTTTTTDDPTPKIDQPTVYHPYIHPENHHELKRTCRRRVDDATDLSLITTADEFTWAAFSEMDIITSSSSPFSTSMFDPEYYPMKEEEESEESDDLFADLGELPDCSVVFGRKQQAVAVVAEVAEEEDIRRRQRTAAFKTTG